MGRKNIIKRIFTVAISFSIVLSAIGGARSNVSQVRAESGISNPRIAEDGTVTWDKVEFGSYYQELIGYETEPIKWRILSINGDDAFLLSDKCLDAHKYNDTFSEVTWETCSLRNWLNDTNSSQSFINQAFSEEEQNCIYETGVFNNEINPTYGTSGGNNTHDKIFILSLKEATDCTYGFSSSYEENNSKRDANLTDYAIMNGAYRYTGVDDSFKGAYWCLRTPGSKKDSAVTVDQNGKIIEDGVYVNKSDRAIRPAIHVKINSEYIFDAGKVSSDGKYANPSDSGYKPDGYVSPVDKNGVVTWDCVYFGNYKQKAVFERKPIEWRVLSINEQGDDAFVLAENGLDFRNFNTTDTAESWETCTLRKWLNNIDDSKSFINLAFSKNEQSAILNSDVYNNEKNPHYNAYGGNNTIDKIYLLSISEATNIIYGFDSNTRKISNTRVTISTDYAYYKGVERANDENYINGAGWRLRSPGDGYLNPVQIGYKGNVNLTGVSANSGHYAVRPVLHVNPKSGYLKNAGTISAQSNISYLEVEDIKNASAVDSLIEKIGVVTIDSKESIDTARMEYNKLTDSAKTKVTYYSILQEAETEFDELVKKDNNGKNKTSGASDTPSNPSTNPQSSNGVAKKAQNITGVKNITKTYSTKKFSLKAVTDGNGKLTYVSSNKKVATVSSDGKVKLIGVGKTKITVKASGTSSYTPAEKTITLTVKRSKQKITSKVKTKTMTYTSTPFNLGTKVQGNAKVTYKSSNPKVLTVSSKGKVTLKGIGKATITIKTKQNAKYAAGTKKIVITVKAPKVKLLKCTALSDCRVKLSWTGAPVFDGYEIQFSLDSKFSEGYTPIDFKKKENTTILRGGAEGRTYYVRIRPYKKVNGKKVTYAWSNVSSFKTFK